MSEPINLKYAIGKMSLLPVPAIKLETYKKLRKPKLKLCPKPECAHVGRVLGMYEHAVLLECISSTCDHTWLVCCDRQKLPIENLLQYNKHRSNIHKKTQQPKEVALGSNDDHPDPDVITQPMDASSSGTNSPLHDNVTVFGYSGDEMQMLLIDCKDGYDLGFTDLENQRKNQRYFQEAFAGNDDCTGGILYLAIRSLRGHNYHPTESVTSLHSALPENTALLQLRLAKMAFGLTQKSTELFVEIMDECYKLGVQGGNKVTTEMFQGVAFKSLDLDAAVTASQTWQNRIPRTINDVRSRLLEGENSIIKNIPHPALYTDVPDHTYVRVIDVLRDFLGHPQNRQPALISYNLLDDDTSFDAVQHPSQSRHAKYLLLQFPNEDKPLTCYLFWWSDDVEPNRLSKSNRGSVWLLTMTIGTVWEDGHNLNHTYPIAIGKKKDNHDLVFQKLEEDMKEVRKGQDYYVGSIKKKIPIRFLEFAHLGDQPERRGMNYLLLGNSVGAPRFGISGNHKMLYSVLRACPICAAINQSRLLNQEEIGMPIPACTECMNWDILKKGPMSFIDPPEHYPLLPTNPGDSAYETSPCCRLRRVQTEQGTPRQVLLPFQITYDGLKGAVNLAHEGFCNLGWSHSTTKAYLKVEGINDEYLARFFEHAANCYSLALCHISMATGNFQEQSETTKRILLDAERNPANYERVPFPPVWSRKGISLSDWANAIMHLLCLGVIKTMVRKIQAWLKKTSRNTAFRKKHAEQLEPLVAMSIEWMNILRCEGDGLGAWVSENYLSFGRVMTWFYQNLASMEKETVEIPDDPKQWRKPHYIEWLQCRGLDTGGLVGDLRERVAGYMAQDSPPEVLPEPENPIEKIKHALTSLQMLMQCVMCTTVTEEVVMKTEYAVRVFLSAYDALESILHDKDDDENYIFSSYNFGSLIDLPEMMRKYGPLRHLWEGNIRGEGFLRFAKPHMKGGLKQRWHNHLERDLLVAKAFDNILPQQRKQVSSANSPDALQDRKGHFQKFRSQLQLLQTIREARMNVKQPISVVLVKDRASIVKVYAVVEDYFSVIHIVLTDDKAEPEEKFGNHYYKFDAFNGDILLWNQLAPDVVEIGYGMMLPLLDISNALESCAFALIGSNWKMLSPSTSLRELVDVTSATFE